ncbi:MAG: hypothetical protein J2P31_11540, partial [Blastocatellia bacterium]|nr:hypothetical protein [Blastocatellia bacterium]
MLLRKSLAWLSPEGFLGQSLLALATALLLILSFPSFSFSFLAWIALAPLLWAIARGVTIRRAFWLGWLAGIVFTFFAENWIAHSMVYYGDMLTVIAYLVALFFAAILAIFTGVFAAALSLFVRKFGWRAIALAPLVWVAIEWLRPAVTGVTWNALGISQAQYFPIAKLARFGGVYLVSAQVVAAAALIVLVFKIRERKVAKAFAALLLGAALMFALAGKEAENSTVSGATVSVLGVQPNLMPNSSETEEAWRSNLEATIRLMRAGLERAPGKSAGIIVWSES